MISEDDVKQAAFHERCEAWQAWIREAKRELWALDDDPKSLALDREYLRGKVNGRVEGYCRMMDEALRDDDYL